MQSARYTCDLNPPLTCTGSVALGSNTLFWWYFALMTYTLVAFHTSVSCHTLVSLTVKELCSLVDHWWCSALLVICSLGNQLSPAWRRAKTIQALASFHSSFFLSLPKLLLTYSLASTLAEFLRDNLSIQPVTGG